MKKTFTFFKGISILIISLLTIFSCTVDENIETEEFTSSNESFAVTAGAKYYLKGNNGKYVSHNNGALDMKCDRTNAGSWEQFYIREGSSGFWYLKGVSIPKYISSENGTRDMRCNRDAVGAWEKFDIEYYGTANGNDVVAFKSRSNSRYISSENGSKDMTCNRTAVGAWEKFELVPVDGGSTTPNTPVTGGDTPGAILGLTNDTWKLNGFTASPSASATYYDDVMDQVNGNIATWSNSNYFFEDDGWAVFRCYRGLGTSQNSNNPRTELRELNGSGGLAAWTNESNRWMQFTVRVDRLSNDVDNDDGVVCVGQIHGPSGSSVDDIVRVQFHGDAGQTSGGVRIKISGDVADANGGSVFVDNGYQLDQEYTVYISYTSNDYVTIKIDGTTVFYEQMDEDEDGNYFKVGNYLQESDGASFDGSYAEVRIKDLSTN